MAKLILVRHGQSTYNARGLWAGAIDCPLTELGRREAREAAEAIADIPIDAVFVSDLRRARQTWHEMAEVLDKDQLEPRVAGALRERDYGQLAGQNKWEAKERYGEAQWRRWRRGWNEDIPGGESLQDVYKRVVPYYRKSILPSLKKGRNVLISAHGNSLRALVKYLDHISDADIPNLEIATGGILLYDIDAAGRIRRRERRAATENRA